ncbi:MAG: hypothetical protein ABWZ58_07325 [Acidimicrobiia bacterium]
MTRLRSERGTWRYEIFRGKGRYVSETADFDRVLAASHTEKAHIDELLYMAGHLDRMYKQVEHLAVGVDFKTDEHPLLVLQGSGVVELRAGGRATQSGSRVIKYRTPNASSYPDRNNHASFVSEPGMQKVIESDGTTIITTQRVLYSTPNWNRSWEYAKTTEIFHSDSAGQGWGASYIGVSNRARTSGFMYRSGFAGSVRDRLILALAVADGTIEEMVVALKAERSELDRS